MSVTSGERHHAGASRVMAIAPAARLARRLTGIAAGSPEAAAVRPLIAEHRKVFPKSDTGLLLRAYQVASRYHQGQLRQSGAPYITHPLAVAMLLATTGMDTTTLVAALLHDTVEDTDLPIGQVKAEFGPEVAVLVDGVTKLDGAKWGDRAEAETFRKMIVAASIDLRVLVIKLADRVHNLRTLRFHPRPEKRERIARASLELLAPFAERLGLYVYLREIEDLTFATLEPEPYARLHALVRETAPGRAAYLDGLLARMRAEIAAAGRSTRPSSLLHLPGPARRGAAAPRRGADRRRGRRRGRRLLHRARRAARALAAVRAALQGLHRAAQVQHVPGPAYVGLRRPRDGGRDHSHARDGPDSQLRCGGADPCRRRPDRAGERRCGAPGGPGLAGPAARLAAARGLGGLPRRPARGPER